MMLTRRDRAAMVLALECIRRGDSIGGVLLPLDCAGTAARILAGDVFDVWARDYAQGNDEVMLRARLALYLRAVLRADAGDFGHYFKTCTDDRCDCWGRKKWNSRRIRPLWESAPKTRAR